MIAPINAQMDQEESIEPKRGFTGDAALNFASFGCLVAGMVAVVKAVDMQQASDGLLCAVGSVAAWALVCYLYLRSQSESQELQKPDAKSRENLQMHLEHL